MLSISLLVALYTLSHFCLADKPGACHNIQPHCCKEHTFIHKDTSLGYSGAPHVIRQGHWRVRSREGDSFLWKVLGTPTRSIWSKVSGYSGRGLQPQGKVRIEKVLFLRSQSAPVRKGRTRRKSFSQLLCSVSFRIDSGADVIVGCPNVVKDANI